MPDPTNEPSQPRVVALGADHAGVSLKDRIAEHLEQRGVEVLDLGTHGPGRVDYPEYGHAVGRAVAEGRVDAGIAVCGSGNGICMAANKVPGVRGAVVHDETSARLARAHNDANVICLGERLVGVEVALAAVDAWLDTKFEGGRHQARIDKIDEIDRVDAS